MNASELVKELAEKTQENDLVNSYGRNRRQAKESCHWKTQKRMAETPCGNLGQLHLAPLGRLTYMLEPLPDP